MLKQATAATFAIILGATAVCADNHTQKGTDDAGIKGGDAATEAVGKAVPTMTDECADMEKIDTDTKAPGTAATEAVGEAVPTMTADDCAKMKAAKAKEKMDADSEQ